MRVVYKGESEPVYLNLFSGGAATDADSLPTLTIKDGAGDTLATPTVTKVSTGKYYAEIGFDVTSAHLTLTMVWGYTLNAVSGTRTEIVEIVNPYLTISELYEVAPEGTSYEEVKAAELYARLLIESYCGQKFHPYQDTIFSYGNDKDILLLPQRIIALESITLSGEVLYDASESVNIFERDIELSSTAKAIRIIEGDTSDPTYEPGYSYFKDRQRYDVEGTFGWDDVPAAVKAAAALIANDFFCRESSWKNKYVKSISASDWRIVFDPEVTRGTGNATADRILDPFISYNWAVI